MENKIYDFSDIQTLLENDGLKIVTAYELKPKFGGGKYDLFLEANRPINRILNNFLQEKDKKYLDNYLDALSINNNVFVNTNSPLYEILKGGNGRVLTQTLEDVQNDFIEYCKEYVSNINQSKNAKVQIDNAMSGVYSKATQIYLRAEKELIALLPEKALLDKAKKHNIKVMGETKEKKKFYDALRDDNNHLIQHIERVINKATAS